MRVSRDINKKLESLRFQWMWPDQDATDISSLNSDLKILRGETLKNAFEAERNAMLDDISKYDSQPRLICFETEVEETF